MPVIEQALTWRKLEARLETEDDPVLRRNLQVVLEHMYAEARLDIDGLMATLNDEPRYRNFNGPARGEFHGRAAVRKFYEDFAASGCGKLHLDVDRLVVDRDCIITEGVQRIAFPGRTLALRGIETGDPDGLYLYEARNVTIWPFDGEGRLVGEDSYYAGDGFRGIADRRLGPGDIADGVSPG